MWIVQLALRRPYTFVVAALLLVLLTPLVLLRTPTDIFPSIDIPVVSVIWAYSGLDAKEIEQRFIYQHERTLTTTVNDIEHTESTSYNGVGIIKVFLQPGSSVDAGVAQITAVAQTILRMMPPGSTPPLIIRYNASTVPILQYSFTSKTLSEQELYDMTQNNIRVGLSTVHGAAIPWPYGGRARQVSVDIDLPALKSKNLSPEDVVNAISAQNLIIPSGTAKIGSTEYAIEMNASPRLLPELNDLPIKTINGATIFIHDVAQVRDGFAPQQNVVHLNGQRGALLTILKSGSASTLDVVSGVKKLISPVMKSLPPGLEYAEFADQSLFVRSAISGVVKEGIVAAALTAIMILLFIGSWRSTVIIAISIPLSVISSILVLSALGQTINLMTLGGLALAVGILVDDATVEIENVHRQMALGKPLNTAILDGAQEIALPAFVSTLCICIVFVPMFFLTGVGKYLFVPLAEAVVFAMLASYVLSRTLIPTMVMWFYRNYSYYEHHAHGVHTETPTGWTAPFVFIQRKFEEGFTGFKNAYQKLLAATLEHRKLFAAWFLTLCIGSALLVPFLGQDFFPNVDSGQIRLHVRARTGTRVEETSRLVGEIEKSIRSLLPQDEISGILDNIGIPNSSIALSYMSSGLIGVGDSDILISLNKDHHPTADYVKLLRRELNRRFPGNMFYFLPADIVSQTLSFGIPAPINIQITGFDRVKSRDIAANLMEKIKRIPGTVDVRVQQPGDLPKLEFDIDRTKAQSIGLSERDVANAVLLSVGGNGQIAPNYWLNTQYGIQYLINTRAPERSIDSLAALKSLPISGTSNGTNRVTQVLDNVATMKRSVGFGVYSHYNVQPVIDIYGNVEGRDLGSVLAEIQPLLDKARAELPRGHQIILRGSAETMRTSFIGLGVGLIGAILLIYFLLVVNFQSWLDPFIIITALPGALAGVVWGLFLTFTTLSVPALMGAIMSMGVATANAVLVVTFARNNLHTGMTPLQAALTAGTGRLRPVIMTAVAMVIGMLPMSLGLGEGGEQNAPLGRAVIGGLTVATFATLFFVPVVFSLMHRNTRIETASTEMPVTDAPTDL